tara:strand:+ start:2040 stop:2630 length:591 start_codon:yes stop_codon:yes gene_type:complete
MIKYKKINDDILLINNFLSSEELKKVKEEIIFHKDDLVVDVNIHENTKYLRMFVDDTYQGRRDDSYILNTMKKFYTKDTYKYTNKLDSFSFKHLPTTSSDETQVTLYGNGGKYNWHMDIGNSRILSYVLPIDINPKKWTGGELVLKYKKEIIIIEPKENQMILFSAHLPHKVDIVHVKDNDIFNGRLVINGHIGIR